MNWVESEVVSRRGHIIFLYDVEWANPNMAPEVGGHPRYDETSKRCIVSDVRLKRTVRDYLAEHYGEEILFKLRGDGSLYLPVERLMELGMDRESILSRCIDARLFGGFVAGKVKLEESTRRKTITIAIRGAVQFGLGLSLHAVEPKLFMGANAFAKEYQENRYTKRLYSYWLLPYALIRFYGIVNEVVSRQNKLTYGDVRKLLEALWKGTGNLISRGKVSHAPRLLMYVEYEEPNYHIYDLHRDINLRTREGLTEVEIRSLDDYELILSKLADTLHTHSDKLRGVLFKLDERLRLDVSPAEIPKAEEITWF